MATSSPVRLRRATSTNRVVEENETERKERTQHPDKPCHRQTDSLFSSTSGFSNYRGLVNLCIVLLALSNGRVALENIIKPVVHSRKNNIRNIATPHFTVRAWYGLLVRPMYWISLVDINGYKELTCVGLMILINIFILLFYGVEVLLSKRKLGEGLGWFIHTANLSVVLVLPAAIALYSHPNPIFSNVVLTAYTVIFLKMISYITVNRWCRDHQQASKKLRRRQKSMSSFSNAVGDSDAESKKATSQQTKYVEYPDNVNLGDIYYFIAAPTLCYELNFPRSARIRKRFLIKRFFEMVILMQVLLGLVQQWIIPTINNSMKPFHESNYPSILERLLKLAIPNHILWLIAFYWLFHSTLNVVAELLRFGDREFYKDWWNCESINEFWSSWNIPVHKWARRHVYIPMVKSGYTKLTSSVVVFLVSAFFHEYLVSVPLRMFRVWAFMMMLGQVPFAMITSKYLNGHLSNMALWLSLIIGQPLGILMYIHDYYVMNHLHDDVMAK